MDSTKLDPDDPVPTPLRESASARHKRISHEAALLGQARASAAAGRTVSEEQVDAWVDSLESDTPLPTPRSGR